MNSLMNIRLYTKQAKLKLVYGLGNKLDMCIKNKLILLRL